MKFFPIIIVHALLSYGVSPKVLPLSTNCEIGRYFAMVINEGGLPYKDVFDSKPPLLYYVASFFDFLGPWGYWLLISSFILATSYILYIASRKLKIKFPILPSLFFILSIRLTNIYEVAGEIREVTCCLLILSFSALVLLTNKRLQVTIGILSTAVFLMLPIELLAMVPISFLALIRTGSDEQISFGSHTIIRFVYQLVGTLFLFIPLIIYLFWHDIMYEFWDSSFAYNFNTYLADISITDRFHSFFIIYGNLEVLPFLIIYITFIGYFLLNWSNHQYKYEQLALALIIFIQMLNSIYSALSFNYYLMSVLPLMSLIFLFLPNRENIENKFDSIWRCSSYFLIIISLIYSSYRISTYTDGYQLPVFIDKIMPKSGNRGHLYVFNNARYLAINTDLNIIAPTKYVLIHEWNRHDHWDRDGRIFNQIIKDLKNQKTQYIVDFSYKRPMKRVELQLVWVNFIQNNYHPIDRDSKIGAVLYEINLIKEVK